MNDLEIEMNRVVDTVIECCVTTIDEGNYSISKADVLGSSKKENATIARNMLAFHLCKDGFSHTTISLLLKRSNQAVRNLIEQHETWCRNSNAYRIANEQVNRKLYGRNEQETP